jgi:hypothetical protein
VLIDDYCAEVRVKPIHRCCRYYCSVFIESVERAKVGHEKRWRFLRLALRPPIEMLVAQRVVTSVDRGHGGEKSNLSGILLTHPSEDHSEARRSDDLLRGHECAPAWLTDKWMHQFGLSDSSKQEMR